MSELERLDEALEWMSTIEGREDGPIQAVLDAARAYRDLLANGQRVEWCEEHRSDGVPRLGREPFSCWKAEFTKHLDAKDCRIVSKLLSVYPKEAENGRES